MSSTETGRPTAGRTTWMRRSLAGVCLALAATVAVGQNRLDVRTARLALLHERRDALTDLARICDEKLAG